MVGDKPVVLVAKSLWLRLLLLVIGRRGVGRLWTEDCDRARLLARACGRFVADRLGWTVLSALRLPWRVGRTVPECV